MTIRVAGRLAVASLVALCAAATAAPAAAGETIANSYICVFKKDAVARDKVNERANAAATPHGGAVKHTYRNTLRGFSATISAQGVAAMRRNNPNIAYCEQDQVMRIIAPGPVAKGKPGGGTSQPPQETPYGVTRVNGGVSALGKTAWVIDSGIDLDHPDLTVDTGRSRYFTGRSADDENGHGTHVAGTIAALNNSIGVIGVAAGASVVAVRVLDRRGSGSTSGVIAGVDYVGGAGVSGDVANMSLGGGVSQALDDAVIAAAAKGVKFTLAAGNESDNANNHSPARANGTNVYTVSAIDESDRFASFSNFGNPPIDWAEPGVRVLSTYKGGGYATLSGTSMAAPHLAGVLLLGVVRDGGPANNDPDGNPDPIGVR